MCSVRLCVKYDVYQKMLRQKTPKWDILLLQDFTYFPKIKGALFKKFMNISDTTFFFGEMRKHFGQVNQFFFSSVRASDQRSSEQAPSLASILNFSLLTFRTQKISMIHFWRHIWKFFGGKWETFRTRQSVLFLIRQSKWSEEFQRNPILITLTLHAPPLPHNFLGIPLVLRFLFEENVDIGISRYRDGSPSPLPVHPPLVF